MRKILIYLSAVLLLSTIILSNRLIVSERERKIAKSNVEVLLSDVEHYKTSDSLNATSVRELQMTVKDLKHLNSNYVSAIKQLRVDKKALEALTSAKIVVKDTIRVAVRDTIIEGDTLKGFNYKSEFLQLNGRIQKDTVSINYQHTNQITIVQSLARKKFLFIKLPVSLFGYRHRKIDILPADPKSKVECAEFVTIKK